MIRHTACHLKFAILLLVFPAASWSQSEPLSLPRAIDIALRANEGARAADERMDAARARVSQARTAFFPTVSMVGTYIRRAFQTVRVVGGESVTIQSLNALSATANANLALLNPHLFPLLSQAKHERDAAIADAMDAKRRLAFSVCDAFLAALSAHRVVAAAEQRLTFAERDLSAARARFDAQLTGSNDVTRAELESATAQRSLTQARGDAENSRLQLQLLLNAPVADSLIPPSSMLETATALQVSIDSLQRIALATRLDVVSSRAQLEGIRASATEALLRFIPDIALTAQYRLTNEAGLTGQSASWFAGANLTWNIFDGGLWLADRSERNALARAAELNTSEMERRVANEIRTALISLRVAKATLEQSAAALKAARTNSSESSARYAEGLGTALEAADANVSLFESEVTYVRDQYNLIIAFLDVRAATGLDPLGKEVQE